MLCIGSKYCYAVMADGLGGHGSGDRASKAAVNAVAECIEDRGSGEKVTDRELKEWFEQANQKVLAMQTKECRMKTTLALLYIEEAAGTASLAHLGDSRIYYFKNGEYAFCTFDHSVSRMAVLAGEIGWEEIRFHADRNKLLKAVGQERKADAEVDEIFLEKDAGHAFLLCTDGFWEYVTEEEMEETLRLSTTPAEWLAGMRDCVSRKAKQDNDNHLAIAVWIDRSDGNGEQI